MASDPGLRLHTHTSRCVKQRARHTTAEEFSLAKRCGRSSQTRDQDHRTHGRTAAVDAAAAHAPASARSWSSVFPRRKASGACDPQPSPLEASSRHDTSGAAAAAAGAGGSGGLFFGGCLPPSGRCCCAIGGAGAAASRSAQRARSTARSDGRTLDSQLPSEERPSTCVAVLCHGCRWMPAHPAQDKAVELACLLLSLDRWCQSRACRSAWSERWSTRRKQT